MIFDDRLCELGEGPLWHPLRGQLFWFDILNRRLMTRGPGGPEEWVFAEMVSAAGWAGRDLLVIACESGLMRFDLQTGASEMLARVDAGQPATRSNDGRADPLGGFWWGTMGKRGGEDAGLGAVWRWHRGEARKVVPGLTIPNAICFPDARTAQFACSVAGKVWRVALDEDGWPAGDPWLFLDAGAEGLIPDGCVIDAAGNAWLAEWGAGRVAVHGPDGRFLAAHAVPDMATLYVTTALEHMTAAARAAHPDAGKVFALPGAGPGRPEPQVML
jgi:sugar lactone lactonase YvrE